MTAPTPGQGALFGPGKRGVARVRRGVDLQITAQRATGQIEPVDEGLIAIARTLADELDGEAVDPDGSGYTVSVIAGRLVPVLLELRGERHDSASDVGFDAELGALVAAVRDAARRDAPDDR